MDFSKFKIQFQILRWVSADEWCVCLRIYYFFSSKLLCGSCLDRLLALMHILHVTYIQYESICHCLFCFGPHFFNCFFDEHIRAHATTNQLLFSISSENHRKYNQFAHILNTLSIMCLYRLLNDSISIWTNNFNTCFCYLILPCKYPFKLRLIELLLCFSLER